MLREVLQVFALIAVTHAGVLFPSGETLEPITDSSILGQLQDPKNTGSQVYDSQGIEDTRLSLNFFVSAFKSPTSRYFRAHPTFMTCLQKTYNILRRDNEWVDIAEGYRTATDNPTDVYLQTGAAAVIRLRAGGSKSVQDLTAVVIEICVPILQEIQRDIGLVLYEDRVLVRLQGQDEAGPHFSASGAAMDTAAFSTWAWGQIDSAYEPLSLPTCDQNARTLSSGETYPPDVTTPEEAVGAIDYPVTRDKLEDFKRLTQYPANNIIFENEERSRAWCGSQARGRCVDCSTKILGSTLENRCADRVMTKRLMYVLRKVQKMVRNEFPGVNLKVREAWDEPHEGAPTGDHPAGSLHYEGRAAELTLSDGDTTKLPRLAAFCICVGAFVQHKGDRIFIAVRKQKGFTPTFVEFPSATLIEVTPPADEEGKYTLPDQYTNYDKTPMPLYDSDHQEFKKVGANVTIGDFKDPSARYFRLSPALVQCYQALATRDNKWNRAGETYRHIKVLAGYLSTENQDSLFHVSDPRYDRHNLGWAMRVAYDEAEVDPEKFGPLRLARFAVTKCGPLFTRKKDSIGVGLYRDSVFVDIREETAFWVGEPYALPVNVTAEDWQDEMAMLLQYSIDGRIIEPDSLERACLFSDPPARQSPWFEHRHSEAVQRRRRRRQAEQSTCESRDDTDFCIKSKPHRDEQVEVIWKEVTRKHLYREEREVRAALEGCIGACGPCSEGENWDDKMQNCNNFMHWVNFSFLNDEPDVTNFWARGNHDLKTHACRDHCIVKAPLFSLLAPSVEQLYRPDPKRSVQEEIYNMAINPLPVMEIMQKIYAAHASGKVTFWVKDKAEMQSLRTPLKVALLFNKAVTEVVIHAADPPAVEGVVQSLVFEWTKSSCPDHTREFITPFSVQPLPAGIVKRSPEFDIREEMLERHRNWEQDWIKSHFN